MPIPRKAISEHKRLAVSLPVDDDEELEIPNSPDENEFLDDSLLNEEFDLGVLPDSFEDEDDEIEPKSKKEDTEEDDDFLPPDWDEIDSDEDEDNDSDDADEESEDGGLTEFEDFDEEPSASPPALSKKKDGDDEEPDEKDKEEAEGKPNEILEKAKDLSKSALAWLVKIGKKFLGLLIKIPFIGPKLLAKFASSAVAALLSLVLPLVLVFGAGIFIRSMNNQAGDGSVSLPDNGSASISNMEYKDGKVTATVKNTGDVIAEVKPSVVIYSSKLINPLSWIVPQETAKCTIKDWVTIDIDKTEKVTLTCTNVDGSGLQLKGVIDG